MRHKMHIFNGKEFIENDVDMLSLYITTAKKKFVSRNKYNFFPENFTFLNPT